MQANIASLKHVAGKYTPSDHSWLGADVTKSHLQHQRHPSDSDCGKSICKITLD